jgi:hypothetical protein
MELVGLKAMTPPKELVLVFASWMRESSGKFPKTVEIKSKIDPASLPPLIVAVALLIGSQNVGRLSWRRPRRILC